MHIPAEMERAKQQEAAKRQIDERLKQSGEDKRLKELLEQELVECGWQDTMRARAQRILSEPGNDNMTVDELVARMTAEGRSAVPNPVKAMLLQRISDFIKQNA